MNVREEERQKNSCPSRGLGLAAAAIGVGVGAALYYIFSKRPENPDGEGSTTGWNTEQPHALLWLHRSANDDFTNVKFDDDTTKYYRQLIGRRAERNLKQTQNMKEPLHDDSDSYITISEHSTSDTSIQDSYDDSDTSSDSDSGSEPDTNGWTDFSNESDDSMIHHIMRYGSSVMDMSDMETSGSDIGTEWDVTDSSTDMPEENRPPVRFFDRFRSPLSLRRQRNVEQDRVTVIRDQALTEQEKMLRDQAFRQRSWSLEECSICFDVILKDQKLTTLPCTHHFHADCIAPWLQEQQTCPNCRKAAE